MKTTRLLALSLAPLAFALAPSSANAMPAEPPGAAAASTSTTTTTTERPVLRVIDLVGLNSRTGPSGTGRLDQLNQAYTDCLIENGAPTIDPSDDPRPVPAANMSAQYGVTLAWPPPADARQACADVNPVFPPALGAATNPTFAAQAQTYVACLQSHGEWVRLLNDHNLDWTYRAGHDV